MQEQLESSHCFSYLSWERGGGEGRKGWGGWSNFTHSSSPSAAGLGRAGGAGGIPKATGTAAERCLWKTGREGDEERGKGRERGRGASAGAWGGGALHQQPPQQPVASPPGPSPAGSGAGGTRGVPGAEEGSYRTGCSNMCPGGEALPAAGRGSGSPGMGGFSSPGWGSRPPPLTQSVRSCLGDHHHHHHPVEPFVLSGR